MKANSRLWALMVNDPTNPGVQVLCNVIEALHNSRGKTWNRAQSVIRATLFTIGWRP